MRNAIFYSLLSFTAVAFAAFALHRHNNTQASRLKSKTRFTEVRFIHAAPKQIM